MKLRVLGSTGYHPNDRRQTACFMLPELGLVFDAGSGMYRVREHLQTPSLDIFLTHAHLDHVFGLTFLFDVLHEKNVKPVRVHALPDKLAAIHLHLFDEALFPVRIPFESVPLSGPVTLADGARLSYFPLIHPGGSIGYRIDWPDKSVAYVTDTTAEPDSAYLEQIRGVDILIHECYFPDGQEKLAKHTGHSCTTPVAQAARAAGVGFLILTHMNPLDPSDDPIGLSVAQAIFPDTVLAEDGMELEF